MTRSDELEAQGTDPGRPCRNCGHEAHVGACEYEPGDRWVTGNQAEAPTVLMALPPCGCTHYEPMSAEDALEREGRI